MLHRLAPRPGAVLNAKCGHLLCHRCELLPAVRFLIPTRVEALFQGVLLPEAAPFPCFMAGTRFGPWLCGFHREGGKRMRIRHVPNRYVSRRSTSSSGWLSAGR
jgi:hypothetical protein